MEVEKADIQAYFQVFAMKKLSSFVAFWLDLETAIISLFCCSPAAIIAKKHFSFRHQYNSKLNYVKSLIDHGNFIF